MKPALTWLYRQIKSDDPLVSQKLGHLTRCDLEGKPLCDGGLADARLTDKAGVVFRS